MQLSARRAKFVDEYVIDCNGSVAARRAGYGVAGARVTAHRLLTDANLLAAIDAKKQELAEKLSLDSNTVIRGVFSLAIVVIVDVN